MQGLNRVWDVEFKAKSCGSRFRFYGLGLWFNAEG